jgi:predicted nucleic acid-binding protein
MATERFLDTNTLLYGYDLNAPEKRAVAQFFIERAWTETGRTAISVQVLQEFYVNFIRKGYPPADASALIGDFSLWPVIDNSLALFRLGISIQARWQLSLWDAMIVAAAQASGASELLTEDLNHGQDYGGVRAINPFLQEKIG